MVKLFANSGDHDEMPHSASSDFGLYQLAFFRGLQTKMSLLQRVE